MRGFTLYVDGACSGNPGPGGWAVVSTYPHSVWDSGGASWTTNNEMELTALLRGLGYVEQILLQMHVPKVDIVSDSQWAVNMALGLWKAKTHLNLVRLTRRRVQELGDKIEVRWQRDGNELADRTAQEESKPQE